MIKPITVNGIEVTPSQIKYDACGLHIGNSFIHYDNPRLAFAKLLAKFEDESDMFIRGGSLIRDNTLYDLRRVDIGLGCVIGGDGFGWERDDCGKLFKVTHLGNVEIQDEVTIANNTCIDRAVVGSTIIGAGTKIDNLVHVAHGVRIGRNCLIVAGSVIGGSVVIGDNCFIGINASIKNKVRIGSNVTVGMGAVVTKDIPEGETWIGNPAKKLEK